MGYLSQLARETTSRVLPPRQEGMWTPRIPQLVEERVAEWPAMASSEEAAAAAEPQKTAESFVTPSAFSQEAPVPPVERIAEPGRPAIRASIPADNQEKGEKRGDKRLEQNEINRREALPVPGRIRSGDEARPLTSLAAPPTRGTPSAEIRQPARRAELLAPSPREADSHVADLSAPLRPDAAEPGVYPALDSILNEIARRQRALEREHRQKEPLAPRTGTVHSPGEGNGTVTAPYFQGEPIEEQVHLNIGSIVVRVDPESEPPRRSTLPERRPQPARDTSNRWARSFLDR